MGSTDTSALTTSDKEKNWLSRLPNTSHVRLFKDADWASSDLGPLDTWGPSLRFAANMVFADSRGACIYWGPQRTAFYNESFMPMAGSAHPGLMGKPFVFGFPELSAGIMPIFEKAEADGATVDVENIPLFTERHGYLEETFFIGQFIPLRGDKGHVEGFYNTVYESTFRVVHDRRRAVLDLVTALPSSCLSSVFEHLVGALQTDGYDLPMMLVYSADETISGSCLMTLEGSIGVPAGHGIAPNRGELHQSKDGLFALFRKARYHATPLIVPTSDESLEENGASLLDGIQWAGFGERPQEVVIAPLANSTRLFGFLVLGTNPRRKFDLTCHQFISDLVQQFLAKLNNAISFEEAQRREESLLRDLAASERRIRYMAMYAPIGMVHLDLDGTIVWANQQYYDILGTSEEASSGSMSFFDVYHEDNLAETQSLWSQLVRGVPHVSGELRLKRLFIPQSGASEHAYVLLHGFPLKEDGHVKYIMGCLTDVSRLKWAESVQSRSATAAQEAKRQQEEFIDLTSHELRNPLGAIMQCAETIASSLRRSHIPQAPNVLEIVHDNIHTAETILTCASHQKRIIDDVLLLSRLDSHMLDIAPVKTNIDAVVNNAERMFSGECKQHGIALAVNRYQSFTDNKIDSVMCDPSRLMQIIINVLANGIKFVRNQLKRELTVTYGYANTVLQVRNFNRNVKWCPSLTKGSRDPTLAPEWGHGHPIYVFFSISDSGPGLSQNEIDLLFQRFVQTTKLTHVNYGGSGLGLYISRQLTEKQGGEIGVASQKGAGATFSFYIKTRQAPETPPLLSVDQISGSSLYDHHHARQLSLDSKQSDPTRLMVTNSKLHVLLAEDNLVNQKYLARGLERHGCTVHVANHGLQALEVLKRSTCCKADIYENHFDSEGASNRVPIQIDLILMDWEMPVLDGLTASKQIRALESQGVITHHVPIIGITANARQEQIRLAIDAGMDDVLPKPFLVSEMMAKMDEWREKIEGREKSSLKNHEVHR